MKWTKERPIKDGFYWWRKKEIDSIHGTIAYADTKNGTACIVGCDAVCRFEDIGGEWAGPIKEPMELE